MPRIRCFYLDCNFIENNYCSAPTVEFDPDMGCATYNPLGDGVLADEDVWEDDDDDDYSSWGTDDLDEDDFKEDADNW